jgi:hypothetical protein
MTIISINTGKELINHTASKFSSNRGGVNQNHLHYVHHASANVVLLATMTTEATCLATLVLSYITINLRIKKPYVIINPIDVLKTIYSYTLLNQM